MNSQTIRELKSKSHGLEPIVRIGKLGLTDSIIAEIKKHLKKRKLVKVKLLKPCLENNDKKQIAKELAEKTGSILVHQVGFVVVLYKAGAQKK